METVLKRRNFLKIFGSAALAAGTLNFFPPGRAYAVQEFQKAMLLNPKEQPLRPTEIGLETNFLFFYPFTATPCFLLEFPEPVPPAKVSMADGSTYAWGGGVGPGNNIVAFTAICPHNQTHPSPFISYLKYDHELGSIHCCAHRSEFSIKKGGQPISGPAEVPLAAVLLKWEQASNELWAHGMIGTDTFDLFFAQFRMDLRDRHGSTAKAKEPVERCVVKPLKDYSREVVSCQRIELKKP